MDRYGPSIHLSFRSPRMFYFTFSWGGKERVQQSTNEKKSIVQKYLWLNYIQTNRLLIAQPLSES